MPLADQIRRCRVCGFEWVLRHETEPRRCVNPLCRSTLWARGPKPNKPRVRKQKEEKK